MAHLAVAVGHELAGEGVRHAFGLVGGGNILTVAGLTDRGVRYIAARHEAGALAMADAYHRVTGDVAVCTTSHGAGLANTATPLAEAARHGSSVLVVCGDAPLGGRRTADLDQAAFAASLGARAVRITSAETARETAAHALRLARAEPGPVVLCLPADLQGGEVGDARSAPARPPLPSTVDEPPAVRRVVDLLAAARRPLILAGLGAWRAGAGKVLHDLADRAGALLATTVMANGLFAGNPYALGICGGFASPVAAELIAEADLVLTFGASLDAFTLHGGTLIDPAATVVRFALASRPAARAIDLDLTADAALAAAALVEGADAAGLRPSGWRAEAQQRLGRIGWAEATFTDVSTADRIDPRALTVALGDLLPDEVTLVLDGGQNVAWPSMYWPLPDPAAMVFMGAAFQAIGLGFAGVVGAAVGRPDRLTVGVLGDGGSLMGLPDLETLVRTNASALLVVFDDASYGFEAHMYGPRGADRATTTFADTDFAGLARALGAEVATVRRLIDLEVVRRWCERGRPGTLLLDCKVVHEVVAPFLADLIARH